MKTRRILIEHQRYTIDGKLPSNIFSHALAIQHITYQLLKLVHIRLAA